MAESVACPKCKMFPCVCEDDMMVKALSKEITFLRSKIDEIKEMMGYPDMDGLATIKRIQGVLKGV